MPDFLLAHSADDLCERLLLIKREFPAALNLGAHNGVMARRLQTLLGTPLIVDMEQAAALLAACEGVKVQASEEALPFADGTFDLITSALALQFVNDLPGALIQARRALKPDGLFLASLLGGETLKELREAWLIAESEITGGASPRVAPCADVRALGSLLQRAGFALPVTDSERLTVTYPNPLALMAEIKAMGASNAMTGRSRRPVSKGLLTRAADIYTNRFSAPDGRVSATFEIITLTAWGPHESQQQPLRPGSAKTRLAEALGTQEITLPQGGPPSPAKG